MKLTLLCVNHFQVPVSNEGNHQVVQNYHC